MNKKAIVSALGALLALPFTALALNFPAVPQGGAIISPATIITNVFNFMWPVIVAVIIIAFITAGFEYLNAKGKPEEISRANRTVIWGIVGIVVILLAFSIISIVQLAFGLF